MNITIISGSARQDSTTYRAALMLNNWLVSNTQHQINIVDCRSVNLNWMESIFKTLDDVPHEVKSVFEILFNADSFILVTPEYNGSYSSALKNLLDHLPKQNHKVMGIVTASTGALGGMRAAQQMLLLCAGMFAVACPQFLLIPKVEEQINQDGNIINENFKIPLHNFITEYLWLSEAIFAKKNL